MDETDAFAVVRDLRKRRKPRVRLGGVRRAIGTAVVGVTLVIAPAGFAWSSVTYLNGGLASGHVAYTPGQASREWNKVWRPIAYAFGLTYSGYAWVYDAWSNPFVDNRNAFFAQAQCYNDSSAYVTNVTCVTTVP